MSKKYFIIGFFIILMNLYANTNELLNQVKSASVDDAFDIYIQIADNYIDSKKFLKAISIYKKTISKYKNIDKFKNDLDEVIKNTAYLYQDSIGGNRLENNEIAANYFKMVYDLSPKSIYLKESLQNAIFDYRLSLKYKNAIDIMGIYEQKFPNDKILNQYLIQKASLLTKLKQKKEATKIYKKITKTFAEDSLSVEAFFHIGESYLSNKKLNNNIEKAKEQFENAVNLSDKLKIKAKQYNRYYYVESLFALTEIEYNEFAKIKFTLPLTKTTKQEMAKNEIYQKLLKKYDIILTYPHKRYGQALLNKIKMLENFGDTKYNQELNKKENGLDDIIYRKEVYNLASKFYEKAIDEYKIAITKLNLFTKAYKKEKEKEIGAAQKIVDKYNLIYKTNKFKDLNQVDDKYLKARSILNYLNNDSTVEITQKYMAVAKLSMVKMQYTIANAFKFIAKEYLKIRSSYANENYDSYFERIYLIDNTVIPAIEEILKAYQNVLKMSTKFNIENIYIEKSLNDISNFSNILTDGYTKMLGDIFTTYDKYIGFSSKYANSTKRNYSLKIGNKYLKNNEIFEEMTGLIDYAKIASVRSIESADNNLKNVFGKKIISKKVITSLEKDLINFVLTTEQKSEQLREKIIKNYFISDSLYWKNTKKERLSLLADYFQENNEMFNEMSAMILHKGYEIIKKYNIKTKQANEILYKLLLKKPGKYVNNLNIKTKDITFYTDMKWKATPFFRNDFYRLNYNHNIWRKPDIINKKSSKLITSNLKKSISIWTEKRAEKNKIKVIKSKRRDGFLFNKAFFFRKDFNLKTIPISGKISFFADDNFILFVNGIAIISSKDLGKETKINNIDISEFLQRGKNCIVFAVYDTNNVHNGLSAKVDLKLLQNFDKTNVINLLK